MLNLHLFFFLAVWENFKISYIQINFPVYKDYICRNFKCFEFWKPEAHGQQRSPECTAMKAIFSQNSLNVACKKN